jgi:hypothetical protein
MAMEAPGLSGGAVSSRVRKIFLFSAAARWRAASRVWVLVKSVRADATDAGEGEREAQPL